MELLSEEGKKPVNEILPIMRDVPTTNAEYTDAEALSHSIKP